jgi:hypothetical protein
MGGHYFGRVLNILSASLLQLPALVVVVIYMLLHLGRLQTITQRQVSAACMRQQHYEWSEMYCTKGPSRRLGRCAQKEANLPIVVRTSLDELVRRLRCVWSRCVFRMMQLASFPCSFPEIICFKSTKLLRFLQHRNSKRVYARRAFEYETISIGERDRRIVFGQFAALSVGHLLCHDPYLSQTFFWLFFCSLEVV